MMPADMEQHGYWPDSHWRSWVNDSWEIVSWSHPRRFTSTYCTIWSGWPWPGEIGENYVPLSLCLLSVCLTVLYLLGTLCAWTVTKVHMKIHMQYLIHVSLRQQWDYIEARQILLFLKKKKTSKTNKCFRRLSTIT